MTLDFLRFSHYYCFFPPSLQKTRGQVPVSHKIMKTEIKIFTSDIFGEIRTCQVNNQIMFVGKDVATALGYSNTRDALRKHVDTEDKGTVAIRDTAYETRVTLINESGLYSLILSSKLPQAKAFKRWVTAEVQHCNNCNNTMFRKNNENKA